MPGAITPGPNEEHEFHFDVFADSGTGFCLPPWFAFGEAYDDGSYQETEQL